MPAVFLSYARADGETRSAELIERLTREAPDIVIKQDRLFLEGGTGWWKQITEAIDSVEFLILLMTPASIASGNVEKEWRYARQRGVCVYPIKGAQDPELQFTKMPRWMSKAHCFDLEKEWPTFLAHLRKGCHVSRVPFMAPDLPPYFVERPHEYQRLKNLLLTADSSQPVAIATALSGAGGFGKTTLAAALCQDEDIAENFDDGILWVTLGEKPDVLRSLITAYAALTGERPAFANEEDAAFQFGQKLEQRTCLLVIDDVWNGTHLRPFLRGGKSSARLFTTRDSAIASEASAINVDEMREAEAISLLAKGVANLGPAQARELASRLGDWPLALELAAAMMRERIRLGDSAAHAAERLLEILERRGVRALEDPTADQRHRTISGVLEVSLELLGDASRERLAQLSIFPEDVAIPIAAAASVWRLDEFDSEDLARRLARLSLLKLEFEPAVVRLHDVMRGWLAGNLDAFAALHTRVVDSWPDWRNLPDLPGEYAWRWLLWHLAQAGRKADIQRILWDPSWMYSKVKATDINALIADCEHLLASPEGELLQGALRLSAHVLAGDADQFTSQLTGRLLPHEDSAAIRRFTGELAGVGPDCSFRLLYPSLHPPGTELVRTLEGHVSSVLGVAVTPDGRQGVSASHDQTLRVWDLETGRSLRTLEGHTAAVNGVAVMPDGRQAVSASGDYRLRVWDLETGRCLRALEGHAADVNSVAVTPDGRQAVSASHDQTLKLWDLETGRAVRTLEGHSSFVIAVALTRDGRALSADWNGTLKVWDLETGRALSTLKGHSSVVTGVAVTPDGRRAVSASASTPQSMDNTLTVWDLETGRALRKLEGHSDPVTSVTVTPDGRLVVSGSVDNTLKVWDLETGRLLRTLMGHSSFVKGVVVTPDGRRAVSASVDKTLKVWDISQISLRRGAVRALRIPERHLAKINGVAMMPDGRRAVSASQDTTLKVWDMKTGRGLRTLEGHSSFVNGVAVTPDGRRVVSASWDDTLKVWDMKTGRVLRTLEGHSSFVSGVAVTPDGRLVVSASGSTTQSTDNTLKVWDLETGRTVRTLEGHSSPANAVAVTPDGRRAISASWDKSLKVWDLDNGCNLQTLKGHASSVSGVAVTPDGRRAVSASEDKTIKVWDLEAGRALRTLEGHSGRVNGVAVTPDGRRVISASDDKTLKVWDLGTGLPLATFTCDAAVNCCSLASGHKIVAGDSSGRLHFLLLEERIPAEHGSPLSNRRRRPLARLFFRIIRTGGNT